MRAYFFGNLYLSSIQQGIQAQHCTVEMYNKYFPRPTSLGEYCTEPSNQAIQLATWAHDHKTDILLQGGYSKTLHEIYALLEDDENPYPFAKFHESEEALDGALTCVGIVIPDAIYDTAKEVRESRDTAGREAVVNLNEYGDWESPNTGVSMQFTKFQVWLINEINKYPLAK